MAHRQASATRPGWRHYVARVPLTGVVGAGLATLAACGGGDGGGGVSSTPSSTATATATPIITPTPSASFTGTAEYARSVGPSQHGAVAAWAAGASGQGVTIGIIDSGIDLTTNEFTGRIASVSTDLAGSRGYSNPDDYHGTMVAMVAAAARNNSGVMGVAYNATLAVFRADTAGSCATTDGCSFADSNIATGITQAVGAGAKVINLSLGGSTPTQAVLQAVTRAASAGVVVVVSAGNDSSANPDAFATALVAAGNGNVIIAGSVGSTNTISSFSNKAGTAANAYLMAVGENICCVYANGAIKVTTTNGTNYVTVYNGTSFSAPQISGAVALLLQAFPNLTAGQAVNLLLSTATDAGDTGTDTTYGRGILNIANAFSAQGATSLGGTSQIALAQGSAITSPAMGDAGTRANVPAVIMDSYNRAFHINLASSLRMAQIVPKLATALTSRQNSMSLDGGRLALAFTVDASGARLNLPWSGALRLSGEDASASKVLAAQMIARLSGRVSMGFAYAQGAETLVAQLQGQARPAFLMASNPLEDTGFARRAQVAVALRQGAGPWGLTLSAEQGKGVAGAPEAMGVLSSMPAADSLMRLGLAADRRWALGGLGQADASLGASWLGEGRGVLGARINPAFGAHGADTLFVDAGLGWRPMPDLRLGAAWREGFTQMRGSAIIMGSSRLVSDGWVVDAQLSNALKMGDRLAFRVSQPLRVSAGGLGLWLPLAYDYDSKTTAWGERRLELNPTGREIAGEMAWALPLWGGEGSTNLFWRRQPGHYASLPDDKGWQVGWRKGF